MPKIERNLKRLLEAATEKEKEVLLLDNKDDPVLKRGISVVKQSIANRIRIARINKKMQEGKDLTSELKQAQNALLPKKRKSRQMKI